MTADQLALVNDAFPKDDAGETRCGHCGAKRKATLALCWHCWRRLSAFIQAEILRSANLVEKAHLIVQTRPAREESGR
jgi:predicted amidophosphoribosyltransferase